MLYLQCHLSTFAHKLYTNHSQLPHDGQMRGKYITPSSMSTTDDGFSGSLI